MNGLCVLTYRPCIPVPPTDRSARTDVSEALSADWNPEATNSAAYSVSCFKNCHPESVGKEDARTPQARYAGANDAHVPFLTHSCCRGDISRGSTGIWIVRQARYLHAVQTTETAEATFTGKCCRLGRNPTVVVANRGKVAWWLLPVVKRQCSYL